MYAIIQVGSQQFRVQEGDSIQTQRLEEKEGMDVTVDKVLLISDGSTVKIGQPYLKGVKVIANVINHPLDRKVISFKYRRRKSSLWKKGHRQKLTTLNIIKITADK